VSSGPLSVLCRGVEGPHQPVKWPPNYKLPRRPIVPSLKRTTIPRSMQLLPMLLIAATNQTPTAQPAFSFNGQPYIHRFTKGNLHEFTPKAQTKLDKFTDMVTINVYPDAKDGDGLAAAANSVLETYKANKAMVVKTSSVPRTDKRPAEHLIVVLFPRPTFIEASFARFGLGKACGGSLVYSHRIYGAKVGDKMSKWLGTNGPKVEKALLAMPLSVLSGHSGGWSAKG